MGDALSPTCALGFSTQTRVFSFYAVPVYVVAGSAGHEYLRVVLACTSLVFSNSLQLRLYSKDQRKLKWFLFVVVVNRQFGQSRLINVCHV